MMRAFHKIGLLMCLLILFFTFSAGAGFSGAGESAAVLGIELIAGPLPVYDAENNVMREPRPGEKFRPMRVMISKSRYWAQDGHMDVVVRLDADSAGVERVEDAVLEVSLIYGGGEESEDFRLEPPGEYFIFYPKIPSGMLGGGEGRISLAWISGSGEVLDEFSGEFRVERFEEKARVPGSVSIKVPNESGVVEKFFPVTAGVPFPRGALYREDNLRLVAADGQGRKEIPMQVKEVARWSRFGSIKWVHIDFTVDLPGGGRRLELEYGPGVERKRRGDMKIKEGGIFPEIDAGRLRFADGIFFDAGDGNYIKVVEEEGLYGAYVEHEDGRVYRMEDRGGYEIEETGPEKVVLKREGWYGEEEGDRTFCKHVTRFIIHRDSPLVRIFHSWIFTGDGNRDRIANMGWEFPLAEGFRPAGFLKSFEDCRTWAGGDYLLQWDYEHFDIVDEVERKEFAGGRAPGAARAEGEEVNLYFGVRDFWQNYPSELEFSEGSLRFHNWPRHNRPAGFPSILWEARPGVDHIWDAICADNFPDGRKAPVFNGDGYVEAGSVVDLGGGDFTYELWFNPSEMDEGSQGLMGFGRGDSKLRPGVNLRYNREGVIDFMAATENAALRLAHKAGTKDKWMHVAVVFDRRGNAKLMLNGEPVDETCASHFEPGDEFPMHFPFVVGRRPYSDTWHFNGAITEIRVWRAARTPDEIREHMGRALTGEENSLLLYWPLDEGAGEVVSDRSSSRNHGVIRVADESIIMTPGEPALASAARHARYEPGRLTRSEWKLNLIQARFAHEGEALDFRIPDRFAENPIWTRIGPKVGLRHDGETEWEEGYPESANAQGISRTEEMWLYFTPGAEGDGKPGRVLESLSNETLRGVVDPAWIASSGALYEIHHQDREDYPEEEHLFEQLALAPARWQERLGLYGMWIYGDLAVWDGLNLERLEPSVYRSFRKRHHGWPYSWMPYARSGDPLLFRAADAATRQNIDVNYRHFGCEDVERTVAHRSSNYNHRRKGILERSTLPWASRSAKTRSYETQVDYLWHSWYLAGYHRAKDNVLDWAGMTKIEEGLLHRGSMGTDGSRASQAVLKSYVETYEATLDPWFLVAAHVIAEGHLQNYKRTGFRGHFWQAGNREFLRFSGDDQFLEYYLSYADYWGGHWETPSWQLFGAPMVESSAFAWRLTGEDYHLKRVSSFLDWVNAAVWDGKEPGYIRGYYTWGTDHGPPMFTGWALQYFPLAVAALEEAGYRPDPVSDIFQINARDPVIAVKKATGQSVSLRLRNRLRGAPERAVRYEVTGPDDFIIAADWQTGEDLYVDIPAGAADGEYRLEVFDPQGLVVPVVKQEDIPEVMLFPPGEDVVLGHFNNQVWFYVPENVLEFYIKVPLDEGHPVRRITVWEPGGNRAWDLNYHYRSYNGPDPVRALIQVEPEQAGRLWRITLPHNRARFLMDPQIPPVFSTDRNRWFMPSGF